MKQLVWPGCRRALSKFGRTLHLSPVNPYQQRVESELRHYQGISNVHDLPGIYHYWSNKFLRPKLERFGFSSPDAFFENNIRQVVAEKAPTVVSIASIGAGHCDIEVGIAKALAAEGRTNFRIDCLDINPEMLARGTQSASAAHVERHIVARATDINAWEPTTNYDVVMANQSLHHVVRLEHLFDAISGCLRSHGVFITSDMIGRNGHMRWPEALEMVQEYWNQLPKNYRMNQQLNRYEEEFLDWDCSVSGFEGIRSQDILPLLLERFQFDLFIPFANIIDPFIDRSFGHHFNPDAQWDRDFIDMVHATDDREIQTGRIKPTHIIAVMCQGRQGLGHCLDDLQPKNCLRAP